MNNSNIIFLNDGKVKIENAEIPFGRFRNFAGEVKGQYDKKGEPYFNIFLNPDQADALAEAGWAIGEWDRSKNDPDADSQALIKVTVDVGGRTPSKIWHVSDRGTDGVRHKNLITYESGTMQELDNTRFDDVDVTLRFWKNTKGLYNAYLSTMYYTLPKDEWDDKWGDAIDEEFTGSPDDQEPVPFV